MRLAADVAQTFFDISGLPGAVRVVRRHGPHRAGTVATLDRGAGCYRVAGSPWVLLPSAVRAGRGFIFQDFSGSTPQTAEIYGQLVGSATR